MKTDVPGFAPRICSNAAKCKFKNREGEHCTLSVKHECFPAEYSHWRHCELENKNVRCIRIKKEAN